MWLGFKKTSEFRHCCFTNVRNIDVRKGARKIFKNFLESICSEFCLQWSERLETFKSLPKYQQMVMKKYIDWFWFCYIFFLSFTNFTAKALHSNVSIYIKNFYHFSQTCWVVSNYFNFGKIIPATLTSGVQGLL